MFPTTPILDDFNAGIGVNWTTPVNGDAGTVTGVTNQATGDVSNASAGYNAASFGPDQESYIDVPTLPGAGAFIQLWVRLNPLTVTANAQSGYFVRITPSTSVWDIRIKNFAASASLATKTQALNAGDSAGISVIGSEIITWYKPSGGVWDMAFSFVDATINQVGFVGFSAGDTTVRLDNFGGGLFLPQIAVTQNFPPIKFGAF